MKSCPKCNRTFPDETQKFCTFDGGLLISSQPFDPNATVRTSVEDTAPTPAAGAQDETSRDLPEEYATTLAKAKVVQPHIEKLITLGRADTPQNRRLALSRLANKDAMRKLFAFAPEQYAGRSGGFTRITKLGPRLGDGAEVVVLELL